jgi:drug/metabolite transporter (DMT)-like permease
MQYIGEAAALATAVLWSLTSVFFAEAGKRIGAIRVNTIRLLFATVIYVIVMTLHTGSPIPSHLEFSSTMWLGLSSIIGLVIGDSLLFKAFVLLGPRLTTLVFASSPIMVTIIAWALLGERLGALDLGAIAITVTGITWVVSERAASRHGVTPPKSLPEFSTAGILLALGGAFGQAAGLVLSKQAMLHAGQVVPPMEASFVRILFAVVAMWLISAVRGQTSHMISAFKDRKAMLYTIGGTIVGPFLGIWMSLVAVSLIEAGIAATLNAMVPVLVIPLVIFYYKEKVSSRAILGAVVAVSGVALLLLY